MATLLYLSSCCLVTVSVMWFFLAMPLFGMQCVIVLFPAQIRLLFSSGSNVTLKAWQLSCHLFGVDLHPLYSVIKHLQYAPHELVY